MVWNGLGYRGKSAPFIEDIFGDCDEQLFSRINTNIIIIINEFHRDASLTKTSGPPESLQSLDILHQYLPDRPTSGYSLRPRRHNKTLINKTSELNDRDFIIRNIYKDLY